MATVVGLLGGGANSVVLWRLQRVRKGSHLKTVGEKEGKGLFLNGKPACEPCT